MRIEGDSVDDRGDEAGVGEDRTPFAEREVACDPDGGFLLSFGDDLEEQFGAAGVDVDVSEFVEQQKIEAAVAGDDAGHDAVVGGLDEVGYVHLDPRGAELLFQIITEREEKASIACASNAPFSEWGATFTDPRLAAAVVDRLTFRGHIIATGTDSYRLRATRAAKKGAATT